MAKPKPATPYGRISLRIPQGTKEKIDRLAKKKSISTNHLIMKSLSFYLGFPDDLIESLEKPAETLQLPVETFIAHIVTRRAAFDKAWLDTFGKNPPGVYREFYSDDEGLVTGDKLLFELHEDFKKLLSRFKAKSEKLEQKGGTVRIPTEVVATFQAGL